MTKKIVYNGIGIGRVIIISETEYKIDSQIISGDLIENEINRFEKCLKTASNQLEQMKSSLTQEELGIIEAHLMMLEDPTLIDSIFDKIKNIKNTSEQAIVSTRDEIVELFNSIEDNYIRERIKDVKDVCDRLLSILLNVTEHKLHNINEPVVIIANDLKPSDTVMLNEYVKGIILEEGSVTSHAAIVAKAKGIPTLVGVTGICSIVNDGELIILDALKGDYYINPSESIIQEYRLLEKKQINEKLRLTELRDKKAETIDGHKIKLYGNIGSVEEAEYVWENGGEGIGLLRTEFLYMNSNHFPTEEEQYRIYKSIAEQGRECIIRTLDIGGDKTLPYYSFEPEMNPFLGKRAIRLCLDEIDIFKTQLRAILRASVYGDIKIMFPMIATIEELRRAKSILDECKDELSRENISFNREISVGMMIEVPSAAVSADIFAPEVDFFSIGTNDLCQYTLAVDRMNAGVSYLYQPLHPSILRLIKNTIKAAHDNNIEVGICGEMAGEPLNAILLTALGVDELSMSPTMIPIVKDYIRNINFKEISEWIKCLDTAKTAQEIQDLIQGRFTQC